MLNVCTRDNSNFVPSSDKLKNSIFMDTLHKLVIAGLQGRIQGGTWGSDHGIFFRNLSK